MDGSRPGRWVSGVLLGAGVMLALASCSGQPKLLGTRDGFVVTGGDDGSNMAGVGLGGTLTTVGKCLGIDDAVAIWPPGTKVESEDPLTISIPGLGNVAVREEIEGGAEEWDDENPPPEEVDIPSGCDSDRVVSFFPNQ